MCVDGKEVVMIVLLSREDKKRSLNKNLCMCVRVSPARGGVCVCVCRARLLCFTLSARRILETSS